MLLGVAEVIAQLKDQWPGTVKFIFQPAEESPPPGEEGGAALMVKEGVLTGAPKPEVIFGQHVISNWEAGQIAYRAGPTMASADDLDIVVNGKVTPYSIAAFYSFGYRLRHRFDAETLLGIVEPRSIAKGFWRAFFTGSPPLAPREPPTAPTVGIRVPDPLA